MKFVQLAKSLQEGLAPVYLIEGEDAYFRDHAAEAVRAACALGYPALNDVRFEGETLKGEKLSSFRDGLYTAPFLDARRLVRVYGFYPSEREWEALAGYVKAPCPTTTLMIVNAAAGKKAGAADLKKKQGICHVDCGKEDEETLSRWLFGLLRREGLSADADAASLMVGYCALDAARIRLETEKLKLLLGGGGRVTRAVVEEYVAKDADYKIYELTEAAANRRYGAFTEILGDLLQKGFDENAVLSALASHYRSLLEIADLKGTDAEIMSLLGIKPYPLKKGRGQISSLGTERIRERYLRLYELSCGAKSGLYGKRSALFGAMAKIFFD